MAASIKVLLRLFHDDDGEWRFANMVKVRSAKHIFCHIAP